MKIPRYSIIQYHRDKQGRPIGVVVAKLVSGKVNYGFSLCMKCDRKKFSKKEALERAFDSCHNDNRGPMPRSMLVTCFAVMDRAAKYFPAQFH